MDLKAETSSSNVANTIWEKKGEEQEEEGSTCNEQAVQLKTESAQQPDKGSQQAIQTQTKLLCPP